MTELREVAADLGATDISTYIASGNLLCTPPGDPAAFDRALERAVQERFGFFREVVSRSVEQLREALQAHPFEVVEPRFSHVYFLLGQPSPEAAQSFHDTEWGGDEVRVIGRDLHIRYRDGVAGTRLTPARIARLLGHHGTGRNLLTVAKLVELADA